MSSFQLEIYIDNADEPIFYDLESYLSVLPSIGDELNVEFSGGICEKDNLVVYRRKIWISEGVVDAVTLWVRSQ